MAWLVFLALMMLLAAERVLADVRPHGLFSDGMVLQRRMKVPVWGTADEGEEVKVTFRGQEVSTTAEAGKWMVKLDPMEAGGPFTMEISGKNVVEINNILVGEVWGCGGQSNMVQPVINSVNGQEEVDNSANSMIRLLTVPQENAEEPAEEIAASWEECRPETVRGFSAVGYFFGRDIQKELGVPVGLIKSCVGGTPAEAWMSKSALEAIAPGWEYIDSYEQALRAYEAAKAKQGKQTKGSGEVSENAERGRDNAPVRRDPNLPRVPAAPSTLYNGMIAPVQPYAIRGVVWYQGEANAGNPKRARDYRIVFPSLITSWRKEWGEGDFPFLFVQLAAYRAPKGADWPLLRESQANALSLENTGMAVAIDVGEEMNIHPKRKQPVGQRLALAARALVYGEDIPYSGPVYDGMEIEDGNIIVSFRHTDGGLVAEDGDVKGFVIAGPDGKFVEAKARIDGDKIVVSSPEVAQPAAVRYAWSDYPVCNLYNGASLPAVPFRSDDF
jgi:sialate O-acetylesterase